MLFYSIYLIKMKFYNYSDLKDIYFDHIRDSIKIRGLFNENDIIKKENL